MLPPIWNAGPLVAMVQTSVLEGSREDGDAGGELSGEEDDAGERADVFEREEISRSCPNLYPFVPVCTLSGAVCSPVHLFFAHFHSFFISRRLHSTIFVRICVK